MRRGVMSKEDELIFSRFRRDIPKEYQRKPDLVELYATFATKDYDVFIVNAREVTEKYFPSKTDNLLVQLAVDLILPDFADYYRELGYEIPEMSPAAKAIRGLTEPRNPYKSPPNMRTKATLLPTVTAGGKGKAVPLIDAIMYEPKSVEKIIRLINSASPEDLKEAFPLALASGNIGLINLLIRRLDDRGEMSEEFLTSKLNYSNNGQAVLIARKTSPKQIAAMQELLIEYGADVRQMDENYVSRYPVLEKQLEIRKNAELYNYYPIQAQTGYICNTLSDEFRILDLRKIALALAVRVRSFKNHKYLSKAELCMSVTENISIKAKRGVNIAQDEIEFSTPTMYTGSKYSGNYHKGN